jgi:hypothetical protein
MTGHVRRRMAWLGALSLLTVACAGPRSQPEQPGTDRAPVALEQVAESPKEKGPSALDDPADGRLPRPLVDLSRVVSGGPPPDGIPAIDQPRFLKPSDVDWLTPQEPVMSLTLGGETRAYPVQVLIWHEIVNDTVGGEPVAVTYCPLCNSALAFDRRVAGRVVSFGTSGKLYQSDLVMYDRQTESLWPQLEGRAVAGRLTGTTLTAYPVGTVGWEEWRTAHPDSWVLSRDTGHSRSYGQNPYAGYDQPDQEPFLLDRKSNPRLPPKTRIVGLGRDTDPVAVTLDRLLRDRVVEVDLDGQPVVLLGVPGVRSALDAGAIAAGREVGAAAAFEPMVRSLRLHLTAHGDQVIDRETASQWDIFGRAVAGPLKGERLPAVVHVDTFWFAWAAFVPTTRLIS